MKKYSYSLVLFITVFSLVSCGNGKKSQNAAAAGKPQVMPVATIKAPTDTVTVNRSYHASIEGIINSEARPKIAGYITNVLVDEGQKVHKGQVMFKLETSALSEDADAAKASIHVAQVKVDQLKPLVAQNIVSENQLATAEAQLKQAQSQYHSIMANIGYATVKSPVNGYVGSIRIRKGNLVSPNDPQPLTTVTDISKVYAYFSMNEKDYLDFLLTADGKTRKEKIKNLPKVTLVLANGQPYKYKGTIQTVNSQINPQTGTVSFRAIFKNPNRILTNGSTGIIKVPHTYDNVVVVPQKATFEQQGRVFVMKVVKTDSLTTVKADAVDVIGQKGNLYLIGGGLKEGEDILGQNVDKIRPGSPIKPIPTPFDSIAKPLQKVF